mgnify:CR=1 FL=1
MFNFQQLGSLKNDHPYILHRLLTNNTQRELSIDFDLVKIPNIFQLNQTPNTWNPSKNDYNCYMPLK